MKHEFSDTSPIYPRCRNEFTLQTLYGIGGNPKPCKDIPRTFFWHNSNGYGFDVRNLAVLLKVNFRNINPHNLDEPIWCNKDDLNSLVNHRWLGPKLKPIYMPRIKLLNAMSKDLYQLLQKAAVELASIDMNGFYNWLQNKDTFDIVSISLGNDISQETIIDDLKKTVTKLQKEAKAAILSHSPEQASEHRFEPGGMEINGVMYKFLEIYKAGIARKLIKDLNNVKKTSRDTRNRLDVAAWNEQVEALHHLNLILVQKLDNRATKKPQLLLHMMEKSKYKLWRVVFENGSKVEFYYHFVKSSYVVITPHNQPNNNIHFMTDAKMYDVMDIVKSHKHLIGCHHVRSAGISGAFPKMGKHWNNILQTSMALCCQSFSEALITNYWSENTSKIMFKHRITRQMYDELMDDPSGLLDEKVLDHIIMNAGCDENIATLESKLWLSLNGETCIQDVATTLCEMLSVPYDPNNCVFKHLDPNHTGIPNSIHV